MFRIKLLNKISPLGTREFDASRYQVAEDVEQEQGILVRSASMHDYEFPDALRAIGRAGAGVNNIPIDRCSEAGVAVFNTPGANANAVKELVICALLLASRNIVGGIEWVKAQAADGIEVADVVEKGKGAFVGPEIQGKTLGVVGLGAIGVLVANAAISMGMEVYGYDPYLSVENAISLRRGVHHVADLDSIYKNCDYISLHLPLNGSTRGMIDGEAIASMKGGVRILNLARGELVNNTDMIAALDAGKVACYVTDFPTSEIAQAKNVIPIPHLGASSPESEENCAVMAAKELREYLENGNVKNSVNLPDVYMPRSGVARLCVIHRNIPNTLSKITSACAEQGINIENMINKSRGDYAYTILDSDKKQGDEIRAAVNGIEGVLRVRILQS